MTSLVTPSKVLTPLLLLASVSLAATVSGYTSISIVGITLAGTLLGLMMASRYYMLLASRMVDNISFVREIPEYLVEDTWYTVKLRIKYPRSVPLMLDIIEDAPIRGKTVPEELDFNTILSNTDEAVLEYRVKLPIGKHCFGNTTIVIRDPLGIFRLKRTIRVEPSCVSVYPKTAITRLPLSLLSLATNRFGGLTKTRRKGVGTEYYDTREYRIGDEIKHIEWKATARTGKLMIKEFEMETANYVFMIGFFGREMIAGVMGKTVFEYTVRSIAAISKYLLEKGDYVGLLAWQPGKTRLVRPKRGRNHYFEILRSIGDLEWLSEEHDVSVEEIVKIVKDKIPSALPRDRVIIIVFASLVKEIWTDELVDLLSRLRMMKNDVIVIAPNPRYFEVEALSGLDAVIYRLKMIEMSKETIEVKKRLLRHGITVVEVGPRDYVESVLLQIEAMRQLMGVGNR